MYWIVFGIDYGNLMGCVVMWFVGCYCQLFVFVEVYGNCRCDDCVCVQLVWYGLVLCYFGIGCGKFGIFVQIGQCQFVLGKCCRRQYGGEKYCQGFYWDILYCLVWLIWYGWG